EAEPDRAFQQTLTRLRDAEAPPTVPRRPIAAAARPPEVPATSPSLGEPAVAHTTIPSPAPIPAPSVGPMGVRRRESVIAAGVVAIAALAIFGWRAANARAHAQPPVLAVGRIRDLVAPESAAVSAVLSEMLATSLGRLTDLPVIANSRMLELTPRNADTSRAALAGAARRAGATEIIEGELIPLPDKQLRLEIRRVDMARGLVRRGYRLSGTDRVALFDSVTALVAADFRMNAPSGSLAEVTTQSPIA